MYKLLVMDVDGTLTDGKIYMSDKGEEFKAFNVKDGYGIAHILPQLGIIPVIITGRESRIVRKRAEELGITHLYQGISNKWSKLQEIMEAEKYTLDEVIYVGDDINDMDCMKMVGFSACPSDAIVEIKENADFVASCGGGQGAVRELIDYIQCK